MPKLKQFDLFAVDGTRADCDRGQHGETVESPAIFLDSYVNVDVLCTRCGLVIATTSWTREAWDKRKA